MALSFRRCIVFLFHALLLTVPFVFTWVNEELFEFPKMLVVYGFTIAICAFWVGRMIIERRWIIRFSPLDWPLLAFTVSQILSTVFSIHPRTSLLGYYTRFHGGLLSTITYVLLYYAFVSNLTKKNTAALLTTLSMSALLVATYALPEHFGHSPSCLLITNTFDANCWVQDVQTRIFGTFGQPNWLAAYTITLLPLVMILTAFAKGRGKKLLFGTTTFALFFTLLFTRSRSGFAGFTVGISLLTGGYMWLLLQKHGWHVAHWFSKQTLMLLGLVVGLSFITATMGSPFNKPFVEYVRSTTSTQTPPTALTDNAPVINRLDEGGTDSGEIRKIVWTGAWNVWKRYPLFGSGVETFAYSYYQDRPTEHNLVSEWDFLYNKAHNEFLNFLATTGIVGLASYVVLLAWFGGMALGIVLKIDTSPSLTNLDRTMILSLLAGVGSLTVSNFFGFSTVVVSVLLFIFMSILIVTRANPEETIPAKRTLSTGQYFKLGAIALVALFLEGRVLKTWRADRSFAQGKAYIEAGYIEGLQLLTNAADMVPNEALYHDELSSSYARVAVAYAQEQQATKAAEYARAALQESEVALTLNPRHLNFYKTRVRVLLLIAQLDSSLYTQANAAIDAALLLGPTDAKLWYNKALILLALNQQQEAIDILKKTVAMKPNYEAARMELAKQYELLGNNEAALAEYAYVTTHITPDNPTANEKVKALSAPQPAP